MNFKDFVSNINATCILLVSLIHQEQANFIMLASLIMLKVACSCVNKNIWNKYEIVQDKDYAAIWNFTLALIEILRKEIRSRSLWEHSVLDPCRRQDVQQCNRDTRTFIVPIERYNCTLVDTKIKVYDVDRESKRQLILLSWEQFSHRSNVKFSFFHGKRMKEAVFREAEEVRLLDEIDEYVDGSFLPFPRVGTG